MVRGRGGDRVTPSIRADFYLGRDVDPEGDQAPRFGVVLLGRAADYVVAGFDEPGIDFGVRITSTRASRKARRTASGVAAGAWMPQIS